MSLLDSRGVYKPFRYPWAYDAWLTQQRIHWLPEEVPLADDVKDWHNKLSAEERHTLTQIFRFFTQSDIEVNNCYMRHYARVFEPTEVQMMLSAFSNMETVHIAAYSHLLDTIGMPAFQRELYTICNTVVEHEDAFIDLAFELGGVEGLTGAEVKQYIRYIADRRLSQLGLQPIYRTERNPLPWMDEMLNGMEHTNFFENRATEYSKAATQGSWDEVWDD